MNEIKDIDDRVNAGCHTLSSVREKKRLLKQYCIGDSRQDTCCNRNQCKIIRNSTVLSTCCHNSISTDELKSHIYPILITATPRSGTVFMSSLLNELGLDIANDGQVVRKHGMVSWVHIFQDNSYDLAWVHARELHASKFKYVWHQLRDPLKCLTSIAFTEPLTDSSYQRFLQRHISLSAMDSSSHGNITLDEENILKQIYLSLQFYLQWHTFIFSLNIPTFRLEDLVEKKNMDIIDEIFYTLDQTPPEHDDILRLIDEEKIKSNQRPHRKTLSWSELCEVDADLTQQFLEMSQFFGYYHDVSNNTLCAHS
jgi:hypothetical protein